MTEAVGKFIPIFAGLFLILRGLVWISDGRNGLSLHEMFKNKDEFGISGQIGILFWRRMKDFAS